MYDLSKLSQEQRTSMKLVMYTGLKFYEKSGEVSTDQARFFRKVADAFEMGITIEDRDRNLYGTLADKCYANGLRVKGLPMPSDWSRIRC